MRAGHSPGRRAVAGLLAVSLTVTQGAVGAAGFGIDFVGARSVGTATAGSAAAADASTIFFNPAGLVELGRNEWLLGGDLFRLYDRFTNEGSTILGGAIPTPGSNGLEAIPTKFIPWAFGSYRVKENLSVGLGVFAPFGLRTDYGNDFVGRYQDVLTGLTVIDVNPVIAYRAADWLSIGGGVTVQYAHVHLKQAIDFGSACVAAVGAGACAGLGLVPGRSDGQTELKADDVDFGYNLGVLVRPKAGSQLGVSYRSRVKHRFDDGEQTFFVPSNARAFLAAGGMPAALTGSTVSTELPLPARLFLGWSESIGPVKVMADATLTKWGTFQSTAVTPASPATGAAVVIQQGYNDAWRYAVGVDYTFDARWAFRGGMAYDETPIPGALVQAALPDRDRIYFSMGASYRHRNKWDVDVGYSYVRYVGDIPINRTTALGGTLRGHFEVGGHVFAAQLKHYY